MAINQTTTLKDTMFPVMEVPAVGIPLKGKK